MDLWPLDGSRVAALAAAAALCLNACGSEPPLGVSNIQYHDDGSRTYDLNNGEHSGEITQICLPDRSLKSSGELGNQDHTIYFRNPYNPKLLVCKDRRLTPDEEPEIPEYVGDFEKDRLISICVEPKENLDIPGIKILIKC